MKMLNLEVKSWWVYFTNPTKYVKENYLHNLVSFFLTVVIFVLDSNSGKPISMYCNGLDPRAEKQLFRGHLAKTEVEFDFPKQEVGSLIFTYGPTFLFSWLWEGEMGYHLKFSEKDVLYSLAFIIYF